MIDDTFTVSYHCCEPGVERQSSQPLCRENSREGVLLSLPLSLDLESPSPFLHLSQLCSDYLAGSGGRAPSMFQEGHYSMVLCLKKSLGLRVLKSEKNKRRDMIIQRDGLKSNR